jgi:membrane protein
VTKIERIFFTLPPVAYLVRKSKTVSPPGFQGFSLHTVGHVYIKQIRKVGMYERAAGISFNLVVALPAAMLFLFSIIPYFPEAINFKRQILHLFKDLTPNSTTYRFIEGLLNDLLKKHVGVFSFGFVLLMFYASNAMIGIIRTFDKSVSEKKVYFLHKRWRAIKLTAILLLLMLGSLLILIGQEQLATILKGVFHMKRRAKIPWWDGVRWFIIIAFIFYGIALIYKFAPSVTKRWKLFSPGSVFATILIMITTMIFSYWVNNFSSYNKVYGSIGTVLVMMMLIYINSLIMLIGFELNVSIMLLQAKAADTPKKT